MAAQKKIFAPLKQYPFSKNRLMIIDWGSLAFHQLFALLAAANKNENRTRPTTAEEEKIHWKAGMIYHILDAIKVFNPMDIIISLEGYKTWRHGVFKEYYSVHNKITYDKRGYFLSYDNDTLFIYKEGEEVKFTKLKDKTDVPEKEIKYDKLPERIKAIVDSLLPRYKESRSKKPWEFMMSKKEFGELRNSFAKDISKILRAKHVMVEAAEGDDIIYVSCTKYKDMYDSIVMVTRDSDMNQLLTIDNLIIFNHLTKELQECKNPSDYLQIKILSGDTSDSIPGILMPDKKKKLGPAGATTFFESLNGKNCFDVAKENGWLEQYIRNRRLIDLSMIPDDIKNDITKSLDEQVPEFCPFWELQGMDIPQRLIEEIAKMKNVGYYCLNNKEEIAKSPDFFKAGSREVKDYTKQEESKILNRIGDSGEYGNLFGIGGVF